jgi:CMP-N,N'-diacetyllegionaminic acid synthase
MTQSRKRVIGIIPARGGSKGIPGKNVALLAGKPLISWVWEAARQSKMIDEIVLSSDDDEIISVSRSLGIPVPFRRPSELASDESLVVDVIYHAITWLKEQQGKEFDYICLLQPTAPMVETNDYDRVIQKAIDYDADTVICVYPCDQQHPSIMFTLNEEGGAQWFLETVDNRMSRRQDLPSVFIRSGLAYVFKTSLILEKRALYGEKIFAVEVPSERGMIDINSPFDLKLAEFLIQDRISQGCE